MDAINVRTASFTFWDGEWSGQVAALEGDRVTVQLEGATHTFTAPDTDLAVGDRVVGPWAHGAGKPRRPLLTRDLQPGEDAVRWMSAVLSDIDGLVIDDPIGEDYGWGAWATHADSRLWLVASYAGAGGDGRADWVLDVDDRAGCNPLAGLAPRASAPLDRIRDRLRTAAASDPAIEVLP